MKRYFLIFCSLIFCYGAVAQEKGVNFKDITLKEAISQAQALKKGPSLIFVDCYTSWCGPCKDMANNIFPQKICGDFFNTNFVNVKFDMEKGEGIEIAKEYSVSVYPTFLILDSKGNEINRVIGSDKAEGFIERVKIAMDPKQSPKAIYEIYNNDKNSENLYKYLNSLKSAYKYDELNSFINNNYFSLTPKERYSDTIWGVLTSPTGAMSNSNSAIFQYVLMNRVESDKFISKSKIDNHILKTFKVFFMGYISGNISEEMKAAYERNVVCANAIASDNFGIGFLIKMAQLKSENKIDSLFDMLNYRIISREGSSLDIEMIEKSFSGNRNLTQKQKAVVIKYFNEKSAALASDSAYAKRQAERLSTSK